MRKVNVCFETVACAVLSAVWDAQMIISADNSGHYTRTATGAVAQQTDYAYELRWKKNC